MPSEFILLGFSWIEDLKIWLSIPFAVMYLVAIFANGTLVLVITLEKSLHEPMYIYISVLALVDLGLSTSVMPKVLAILWFDANSISATACLSQMVLIYCFEGLESSLFLLMSFDRYVAICNPLRYSSIINQSFVIKSLVFIVILTMGLLSPMSHFTKWFPYCDSNILYYTFCDHLSILKLACGDFTWNTIYLIMLVCAFSVLDNSLIALSYLLILQVVVKLGSPEARKKAFSTCSSHIIVILFFAVSTTFPFLLFLLRQNVPMYMQVLPAMLSNLVPPLMNPIVYGVRTKEIQHGLHSLFKKSTFR
ncbi:olfactory receptor 52J3-like [Rhinatrema bivittatum]|uniref:olfactory receptor 52J3-like n=1 Tax=Rhinatrema bivittatum TaxID=194408 RepID=UPI00112CBC1E|nr:olfactory receptor 52J3-like [Rhinatrema bivittatum]